jgi:tetratricopeptide (TPR) repeat protein
MLGFIAMTSWCQGAAISSAVAQESKAPESQTPEDLEAEYDRAFQTMFADPANLDKAFAYAKIAIRTADFEGAISTLERMLIIDGNLPRVRMELGVLYYRLKSLEVAKGYFEEVLADKSAPPVVVTRVKVLLARIESETSVHKFQGTLYSGIRHQSNANAGPSNTRVKVLGLDVDLDTTFTNKPDIDTFETVRIQHSYDFGVEPRVDLESELVLYNANQATQDQVDSSVAQVKSGPRFVVDPDIARGLVIHGGIIGHANGGNGPSVSG